MDATIESPTIWSPTIAYRLGELEGIINVGHVNDHLRHQLDVEISQLAHATRALASLRNRATHIGRLNSDILTIIFEILAGLSPPMAWTPNSMITHGELGWISITHVCRSWRALAFDLATLWARDLCSLPRAFDVMLQRSRDAALKVELPDPREYNAPEITSFVMNHLHRINHISFNLAVDFYRLLPHIRNLQGNDAPALETLKGTVELGEFDTVDPDIYTFDPVNASGLRVVDMHSCFIPWKSSSLTHLTLEFEEPGQPTLSPDQLLELLDGSPALQYLELSHRVPIMPPIIYGGGGAPQRVVHLPQLQIAYLSSMDTRCVDLWRYLVVSPLANVCLELWDPDEVESTADIYSTIRDATAALVRNALSTELPFALSINDTYDEGLLITLISTKSPYRLSSRDPFRPLLYTTDDDIGGQIINLRLQHWDYSTGSLTQVISIVRVALAEIVAQIRRLDVDGVEDESKEAWYAAACLFQEVDTLAVRIQNVGIVEALAMPSLSSTLALPKLRTIVAHYDPNATRDGCGCFKRMLITRADKGCPIQHIRLVGALPGMDESPKANRKFIARIRKLVEVVDDDRTEE